MMGDNIATRGEFRMLPDVLQINEIAKCAITGTYNRRNGMLVATDRRMLFLDKQLFGAMETETILYNAISAVQWSTGMMMGSVTLHAHGKSNKITNVDKQFVRYFANYVETRLMGGDADAVLDAVSAPRYAGETLPKQGRVATNHEQIANCVIMGNSLSSALNRGKLNLLPTALRPGEIAKCATTGKYNGREGMLVATDQRLLFVHKQFRGSAQSDTIMYDNISAVEAQKGMMYGRITLHFNNMPNKITDVDNDAVAQFARFVETRINGGDADQFLSVIHSPKYAGEILKTPPPTRTSQNEPTRNQPPRQEPTGGGQVAEEQPRKWRWLAVLWSVFGIFGIIGMIIGAKKNKTDGVSWAIFAGICAAPIVLMLFTAEFTDTSSQTTNYRPRPVATATISPSLITPQLEQSMRSFLAANESVIQGGATLTRYSRLCRWANLVAIDISRSPNPSALGEFRSAANSALAECRASGIPTNSNDWDKLSATERANLAARLGIPMR